MNELMRELEAIQGRHQVASDFQKSLALLRALKAGQVGLSQVVVSDGGWTLIQVQIAEPEPVGLPQDVLDRIADRMEPSTNGYSE